MTIKIEIVYQRINPQLFSYIMVKNDAPMLAKVQTPLAKGMQPQYDLQKQFNSPGLYFTT